MTKSFRFGYRIATVANVLLNSMTTESRVLIGKGRSKGNVDALYVNASREWWRWPLEERTTVVSVQSYTILFRTNATIFQVACELMQRKEIFLFIGGVAGYRFQDYIDTSYVLLSKTQLIVNNNFLKRFRTPAQLIRYAQLTNNQEINTRLRLIEALGGPASVVHLCTRLIQVSQRHEDQYSRLTTQHHKMNLCILGTVHKAKGLEFNNVIMADDFVDLSDQELKKKVINQERGFVDEFNLIYVGVTRAKQSLRCGPILKRFLLSTGMLLGLQYDVSRAVLKTPPRCFICESSDGGRIGAGSCWLRKMSGVLTQYVCAQCTIDYIDVGFAL